MANKGFTYCVFAAILLIIFWTGANYHYEVVSQFAATHLEPNSGESPQFHEKRQLAKPVSTGYASHSTDVSSQRTQSSSIPTVSVSTTSSSASPSIPAAASASASNAGGAEREFDGAQLALVLGIAGIVLAL